jgi:hypothetical protein
MNQRAKSSGGLNYVKDKFHIVIAFVTRGIFFGQESAEPTIMIETSPDNISNF